jgi:hypothetical protein
MKNKPNVKPTGTCFCGCRQPTAPNSFFLPGHDKRAESMLTKLKHGPDNAIANRVVAEGYGPDGPSLLDEYQGAEASDSAARIDHMALVTVNDMSRQPGVAEAVVFIGTPTEMWEPSPTPGGDPEPTKTSTLTIPQRASILAQGFAHALTDAQKLLVQSRFPGRTFMWVVNS